MVEPVGVPVALRWPILERIPLGGDLAVSPHGLMTAVGFLVGAWMMIRRARRRGLGHTYVEDVDTAVQELLLRVGVGAIVGARLFYVLNHLDVYVDDPVAVLAVWQGGLTFLGGVAGAVVGALPLIRRRGYRTVQLLDSAMPGLTAGLAIGRLGDLAIGEHLGPAAGGFPLGWTCSGNLWDATRNTLMPGLVPAQPYPAGSAPVQGCYDVAVHQTALYDLLAAALLVGLLLMFERQPRWDGFFTTVAIYGYGAFRLVDDLLRQDRRWAGLTGSQWAVLAGIGILTAVLAARRPWRQVPWAWAPPDFELPWRHPPTDDGTRPNRPRAVRVVPPPRQDPQSCDPDP